MASSVAGVKRSFLTMAVDLDSQINPQITPDSSSSSENDRRAPQRLRRAVSSSGQCMLCEWMN